MPYESAPLNYTKEANHRIFVGISWDPKDKVTFMEELGAMIKGNPTHHDLDLGCAYYDATSQYIGMVHADPTEASDEDGKIYHSGDNVAGEGDGDDEEISVELKDLNPNIHHLFFFTSIKTGHTYDQVTAPEIHLADAYSGRDLLYADLRAAEKNNTSAYVFAHIFRDGAEWMLAPIEKFVDLKEEWGEFLKVFLK
ncbi:MAG: TerD family protein [Pseudomonadota bacterium]